GCGRPPGVTRIVRWHGRRHSDRPEDRAAPAPHAQGTLRLTRPRYKSRFQFAWFRQVAAMVGRTMQSPGLDPCSIPRQRAVGPGLPARWNSSQPTVLEEKKGAASGVRPKV